MSKRKREKMKKLAVSAIAILLVALMLLPILVMITGGAQALSEDELREQISNLQGSAADLKAEMSAVNSQLAAVQNDKNQALKQKALLDSQMANLEGEIANIEEQISTFDALIVVETEKLAQAEEAEAEQYALFCERVRVMEETGSVSYWSILFDAADFADLLDRSAMIKEVMEYDDRVAQELAQARQAIADSKAQLEQNLADQEQARSEQLVAKDALEVTVAKAQALVNEIQAKENEYDVALAALKREENAVEAQIIARQKELEAKIQAGQITFDPGTGWLWPLKNNFTLTSLFGPRIHPITGRPGNHGGTDVAAPKNTPILSARGGIVTLSTYNNSYGNYVVVQHDGGYSTLYAHMNSRGVKEGDVVSQGQVIGYIGTTGSSSGYHLHYELRLNGVRVDALDVYPSLSFSILSGGKIYPYTP